MNGTNLQTWHALRKLAPKSVTLDGRAYKQCGSLYSDPENTIHWDYKARKKPGAFLPCKVRARVEYVAGLDLYNVQIVHFDGLTLEDRTIAEWIGCTFESFASIGEAIANA